MEEVFFCKGCGKLIDKKFCYCPWCGKSLEDPSQWEDSIIESCKKLDKIFEKNSKNQRFAAMEDKLNQIEVDIDAILRREKK